MPLELKPFYSLRPHIDDAIFDRCFFDKLSLSLIEKSDDRIAVVGWVLAEGKDLPLGGRPGLRLAATSEDIAEAKLKYGDGNFVLAKDPISSAGTGVVHTQTREQCEESNPAVKGKYIGHIGCSFQRAIINGDLMYLWTARSAFNKTAFEPDELALGCNTFHPFLNSVLYPIRHLFEEDVLRTMPLPYFKRIMAAAVKQFKAPCFYATNDYENKHVPMIDAQKKWEGIRKMGEKEKTKTVSTLLATNIYIASSLPKSLQSTNPYTKNRNGYERNLKFLLKLKNKYAQHLTVNVDFVPDQFHAETKGATGLIMAAKQDYFDIAELLLQNGANIHAKTTEGDTPILVAALNGNVQMMKFLLNHGASLKDKNKNKQDIYDNLSKYIQSLVDRKEFKKITAVLNEVNDFLPIDSILLSTYRYLTNSRVNPESKSIPKKVKRLTRIRMQNNFLESKMKNPETEAFLFNRFQKRITSDKFVLRMPPDLLNYFIAKQVSTGLFQHKRWLDTLKKDKKSIAYWLALHGADEKSISQSFSNTKIMKNIYTCSSIFNLAPKIQNDNKNRIKKARLKALDRISPQAEKISDDEFATRLNFLRLLDDFISKLMEVEECKGIRESCMTAYSDFATEKSDKDVLFNLIDKIEEISKSLQSSNSNLFAKSLDKLNNDVQNVKDWYKNLMLTKAHTT